MSLRKYLEKNKLDQIENDQEFEEAEYTTIQTYCENCGYVLGSDDIAVIKGRGYGKVLSFWKETYIRKLWEEFGNTPINPDTEEIEIEWNGFSAGTHREDIWHWFEETFNISVAEDLMGL